ncbi:twin transmembrane helix small protein [Parvularcula flava]|uniref:Twin transmembrane helix small protein n=1 Tax=Aquisalinus luteolus TaxID=1566827 RepID=A0A8J3EPX7_9PROT|nr:twin transmembrane helix small protein [Aquisalinus luteolus]NHK26553.1 twin transmembrane helix small protein [Aquisalinus luteolus]GGH92688.1 hypothetical protein GCM10011355_02770 [Aquisalinus luteolus]
MSFLQYVLIPIAMLATLGALGFGIYSLARGGEFAKNNSNRLMRLRVLFQAIAIALMMLFLWLLTQGN